MIVKETNGPPGILRWLRALWGLTEKQMARALRISVRRYRREERRIGDGYGIGSALCLADRIREEELRRKAYSDLANILQNMASE